MSLNAAFLRTRVARRILGLFVVCALLPIGALAVFSFVRVARQLSDQGRERVREISKATGMAVLERLQFLESELGIVAWSLQDQLGGAEYTLAEEAESGLSTRLRGLGVEPSRGDVMLLLGSIQAPPQLTAAEVQHLRSGRSLLSTPSASPDPAILLGRAIDHKDLTRGILWAELQPRYLLAGQDGDALPSKLEICVFDQSERPIFCSAPGATAVLESLRPQLTVADRGDFEWSDDGDEYLAAYWPIFLKPNYLAPTWTAVLSQSRASVLRPMNSFKEFFIPTILLALWVVLLLSNVQIRRTLDPLEKLQEGTRRVAMRDFTTPVKVESRDEFEDLAMSFNSMAHRLGRQFSALTAINELDRAVLSALDTERIIETVLWRTHDALGSDGVSLSLAAADGAGAPWTLIWVDQAGGEKVVQEIRPKPEDLQELRDHPEHLFVDQGRNPSYLDVARFAERGMRFFVVLPMFLKRKLSGVIALGYKDSSAVNEEDLVQARQLADQVAVALSNARLVEELDQFNWGALAALAQTVDAKSPWTAGHSERVTRLSLAIGHKMALGRDDLDVLHRGGLLHDIGKIGVPAAVLDKPGKLTDEEWQIMRDHVTVGARILTPIAAYADLIPIVLRHHERYDGSGYPDGLVGEDTPFLARVLAVPDVYDALNSDRPYRPAWPRPKVIEYLTQGSGTLFDPEVTKGFLAVMEDPAPEARYETFPLLPSVGS